MNNSVLKLSFSWLAALVATASLAAPGAYVPLGSANKVIGINVDTNQIVSIYTDLVNPHGLAATPGREYLVAGSLSETPAAPVAPKVAPTSNRYLVHSGGLGPI